MEVPLINDFGDTCTTVNLFPYELKTTKTEDYT